jgi:excisionase family DNA binding protein
MSATTSVSQPAAASLLTVDDVAQIIGMRTGYVYALARRDEIPHLRFGRTIRFRAEAIEEWLCESERGNRRR